MNRLYPYTFTPAVQKEGRFAVQTDDLERDRVLRQRIGLFGWLSEEHLDVPVGDHSRGFVEFSIQELLKINHYKAPRDKLICILNCCKVIFGMNPTSFIARERRHLHSRAHLCGAESQPGASDLERRIHQSLPQSRSTFERGRVLLVESDGCHCLYRDNGLHIAQQHNARRVREEGGGCCCIDARAVGQLGSSCSGSETRRNKWKQLAGTSDYAAAKIELIVSFRQRTTSTQCQRDQCLGAIWPGEEAAKALPFTPMAATLADDTRAFFLRTGEAARTGLSRPMGALGRLINEGIEGIRTPSTTTTVAHRPRGRTRPRQCQRCWWFNDRHDDIHLEIQVLGWIVRIAGKAGQCSTPSRISWPARDWSQIGGHGR